jgi:hypothetical protein
MQNISPNQQHTQSLYRPCMSTSSMCIISCCLGLIWTPAPQLATSLDIREISSYQQYIHVVWHRHIQFTHLQHLLPFATHLGTSSIGHQALPVALKDIATHVCSSTPICITHLCASFCAVQGLFECLQEDWRQSLDVIKISFISAAHTSHTNPTSFIYLSTSFAAIWGLFGPL